MNGVWHLPEVRAAAERLIAEAALLRLEQPHLTPLQRLQAARARAVNEMIAANVAIAKTAEMARAGPWKEMALCRPWEDTAVSKAPPPKPHRQTVEERYARIREVAAAHPELRTFQQIADRCGCTRNVVRRALPYKPKVRRTAKEQHQEVIDLAAANPAWRAQQIAEQTGYRRRTVALILLRARRSAQG
jgi:CRP-like cAMP-binding protein